MKYQAFYKDLDHTGGKSIILFFKINDDIFSISFGSTKLNPWRRFKQMSINMLKKIVISSSVIVLYSNQSNYVFDSADGCLRNISENKELVELIIRLQQELKQNIYKEYYAKKWKDKLIQELYFKVFKFKK